MTDSPIPAPPDNALNAPPTNSDFGAPPSSSSNTATTNKAPANGLGITSLILGIVAVLGFAVPVVNVFSALLAVVGLVLGIIALARRAGSRGLSLSGTIVSAIALVLSVIFIIIYAVGLGAAIDEVASESVIIEEPAVTDAEPAEASEEPDTAALGTRENPATLGSTIELGEFGDVTYEVTLGPATLNANEAVVAANQFNEPPTDGFQYALLPVTVTYVGAETGTPWIDLSIEFVSAAGTTHTEGDTLAVAPAPTLFDINEMYDGSTAAGNVLIMIPTDGAASGTWTVSSLFGDPFFFTAE
ncbi:MAG: DUF4190 domain-containing protein [Ilumatobacteraceae bacterium]|nr:DUF4190 domain-containing protein [Ilumatobacteraceae bacterium]